MRAFGISVGAFALVAIGAFALTACSSSSNDASTFVGGPSDASTIDADCADAVAFTCPTSIPTSGDPCNAPNACTSSSTSQTACPFLCADGQQQFVASCPSGQWVVFGVNDCNPNFDAGPDASAIEDAGDAE